MPKSPAIWVDKTGSLKAFKEHLSLAVASGAKGILILACEEDNYHTDEVDQALVTLPVPVFGGVFPQIIVGNENLSSGSIVCGFYQDVATCEIEGLSDSQQDFVSQMEGFSQRTPLDSSLFVFVDGLSHCIAYFLEECFGVFGSRGNYLGGGCGSLSFQPQRCVFTNQGMRQDIGQIASITEPMATAVEHGWRELAGPFLVTGATNNRIQSLDYRPAFDVYREVIRNQTGQELTRDNFFDHAKGHPFGLSRIEGQVVVRDPLLVEGDVLVCVGEVPANHLVYILRGEASGLLEASARAAKDLSLEKAIDQNGPAFTFDCISRVLYLGDQFCSELNGIKSELPHSSELVGALSLGEIACSGDTCLEFFNKSIVIGVFQGGEGDVV